MSEITERNPTPPMIALSALAMGGFIVAAVLWGARPDPLVARVVACASALALLAAGLTDPHPGIARTVMRTYAATVAAVFAVASMSAH